MAAIVAGPAPAAPHARTPLPETGWRAAARRALRSAPGLRFTHAIERAAVLMAPARPRQRGPRAIDVVMLPAGGGNIGDQAMFEAYLANTPGEIVAVMRTAEDFVVPEPDAVRVRAMLAPRLTSGSHRGRGPEMRALAEVLRTAKSFAVIGADIMDGGYDRVESVTRAELLWLADRLGAPARLLGFSWGDDADPVAAGALRRAARRARLFVRDPVSAERLHRAGITAIASADLAFTVDDLQEPPDVAMGLGSGSDPLIVLNLSGLVGRSVDLVPAFTGLIDRLTADGARVVLLPHCVRDGDDDLPVCRRVASAVVDPHRVLLVERTLRPAEVRWLTARAGAVVTGRMHLSILALTQGTPVVVLSTRGKVEGLARMFGLDEFVLEPVPGIGAAVDRMLSTALSDVTLRERIRAQLPHVTALARKPFGEAGAHSERAEASLS